MPGQYYNIVCCDYCCSFAYALVYSDARSASVVDDRIRPALESGSAVGSSKPVLIIIDEIDGATGGGDNVGRLKSPR